MITNRKISLTKPETKKKEVIPEKIQEQIQEKKNENGTETKVNENNSVMKENHYGIGLIGDSEVLRVFKAKCKLKNLRIGKILNELISEWNSKN